MAFVRARHLRPAVKHGAMDLWVDTLMRGGDEWNSDIERKLANATCSCYWSRAIRRLRLCRGQGNRDHSRAAEKPRGRPLLSAVVDADGGRGTRHRARQEFASARFRQAVLKLLGAATAISTWRTPPTRSQRIAAEIAASQKARRRRSPQRLRRRPTRRLLARDRLRSWAARPRPRRCRPTQI